MVLAVLVHLVVCAHGPLAPDAGRIDTLKTTSTAPAAVPQRDGPSGSPDRACEGHHGEAPVCDGLDEPAVALAEAADRKSVV